jgi:hypothetical protein
LASTKLQLDVLDSSRDENAELAVKAFELSQALKNKWIAADHATKRRILEGKTLVPTLRKPFDVLA